MELGKMQYFENIESSQHREFIMAHNNCILCGTALELRHIRSAQELEIKEEAHCPECKMRTRARSYILN